MVDINVHLSPNWEEVARQLKRADKTLKSEMRKGTTRAVRPFPKAVKANLETYLPDNYAPAVRKSLKMRTKQRLSGVRVDGLARGKHQPREIGRLNRGDLRHKLFGRSQTRRGRSLWFKQRVKPGFWTEQAERLAPHIRNEIAKVLETVARKIMKG